jgi:hypothetical protein
MKSMRLNEDQISSLLMELTGCRRIYRHQRLPCYTINADSEEQGEVLRSALHASGLRVMFYPGNGDRHKPYAVVHGADDKGFADKLYQAVVEYKFEALRSSIFKPGETRPHTPHADEFDRERIMSQLDSMLGKDRGSISAVMGR